jgi:hypothetical protein
MGNVCSTCRSVDPPHGEDSAEQPHMEDSAEPSHEEDSADLPDVEDARNPLNEKSGEIEQEFIVSTKFLSTAKSITMCLVDESNEKAIDLIRKFLNPNPNPNQKGHGIDVRCWAQTEDESKRLVEAFTELLNGLKATIEHPHSFALSLGLLQALEGVLLMINSSLGCIEFEVTKEEWVESVKHLTRLIGKSTRLGKAKGCSVSALIYHTILLEILLISMPDPKMLGKVFHAGENILQGET